MSVSIAPASAVSELVFHGLAWLGVGGHPASLFDARYHAWARANLPRACVELFEADGPTLAARFVQRELIAWHALPTAFGTTRDLRRFAGDLSTLHACDPRVIDACMQLDREGTEWLALDLAYAARDYEAAYERALRPALEHACARMHEFIERACALDPSLRVFSIELSTVLGGRGRALANNRLFTGAVGLWSEHDERHSAVQLLHECAVRNAGDVDYVCAEWRALTSLSRRAAGSEFEECHARWVAAHDLRPLVESAVARGYASHAQCERIAFGAIETAAALRECPALA